MSTHRSRWCLLCTHQLPDRRWWQRGLFAPLPLCPTDDATACSMRFDPKATIR